jgi:hypothetical protein
MNVSSESAMMPVGASSSVMLKVDYRNVEEVFVLLIFVSFGRQEDDGWSTHACCDVEVPIERTRDRE